ncbi:unnamed protein product [Sphagnum troendelagicum]|uniref:Cation/H+ exchanger domain-containing protein n=1 Tax=Sphagnum troendelagicum TaxID=128251 RepID=A0ABP0U1V3_9BRYO
MGLLFFLFMVGLELDLNGEAGISDCCCRNHVTVHCRSWGLFCAEADDRPRRKIRAVFCVHGRSDVDHGVSGARAHSSGTQVDNRCGTARNVGGCSKRRGRVGASCARCGALGIREESDDCPLGATMRYRLCHLHDRRSPARNDLDCSPLSSNPEGRTVCRASRRKAGRLVAILLLPLSFAISGLKTNVGSIHGATAGGLLVLVITVACLGKITGTFLAAKATNLTFNKSLTLGVLMNTKGLVELIVLNIGRSRGVLNEETFAIMVLMALFTTFITTPLVMALYKPAGNPIPYRRRKLDMQDDPKNDLRILSCVHGMKNVPTMINLMETTRGICKHCLRLFILHLMELSERTSAIMMVQRARRDGRPFINEANPDSRDQVVVAFEAYGKLSKVTVRPMTVISGFEDMHEDICTAAADKRVVIIILPFHKNQRLDGTFETTTPGFRNVNHKVLQHAPCPVAILVDHGLGGSSQLASSSVDHSVVVLFFGGADDREALAYGCRMAECPGVKLHVIHFILPSTIDSYQTASSSTTAHDHIGINMHSISLGEHLSELTNGLASASRPFSDFITLGSKEQEQQRQLDNEAIALVQGCELKGVENKENGFDVKKITYEEISDVVDPLEAIFTCLTSKTNAFDLVLVGRSRRPTPIVARLLHRHAHCSELSWMFSCPLVGNQQGGENKGYQRHGRRLELQRREERCHELLLRIQSSSNDHHQAAAAAADDLQRLHCAVIRSSLRVQALRKLAVLRSQPAAAALGSKVVAAAGSCVELLLMSFS